MSRLGRHLGKGSLGFACLLTAGVLMAGCGSSTTGSAGSGGASPKPVLSFAGLVDVGGGRKMFLACRGSGSPTVILVSGARGAHDDWTYAADVAHPAAEPTPSESAVFPEVASFTRVCAYDRPGTLLMTGGPAASDPVPQPTTAQAGVADLTALLAAAHEPGPYVLVGASWGGMIVNLFARSNRTEVSGLAFVDGASEFLKATLTPTQWAAWQKAVLGLETAAPSGGEVPDYDSAVKEIRAAPPIADVPAVVLTADKPWNLPVGDAGSTWPAWLAAQDRLAGLLHARHIMNTDSGHPIGVEQPRLVADAIRDVVDKARQH